MLKVSKFFAPFVAIAIASVQIPSMVAAAEEENPLNFYAAIVEEFNEEYGTTYQIATSEQLERIGSSTEELIQFFNAMSEEEYRDYLYDSYLLDVSEKFEIGEIVIEEPTKMAISPMTTVTETQQNFYYNSGYTNYLGIVATWVSVDGANRYITLKGFTQGQTKYPYYDCYKFEYNITDYSQAIDCTYHCARYTNYGFTDLTDYTLPVTFRAGAGHLYRIFEI